MHTRKASLGQNSKKQEETNWQWLLLWRMGTMGFGSVNFRWTPGSQEAFFTLPILYEFPLRAFMYPILYEVPTILPKPRGFIPTQTREG